MKYMMLINGDEASFNAEPAAGAPPVSPEFVAYTEALIKAGVMLGGERLRPTKAGARVRVRDGKSVVLDGPYSDTREQLGGYYLIDVPSLAEAISWAERCPAAKYGSIDVRPLMPGRDG